MPRVSLKKLEHRPYIFVYVSRCIETGNCNARIVLSIAAVAKEGDIFYVSIAS
jgi:hypothetical protein